MTIKVIEKMAYHKPTKKLHVQIIRRNRTCLPAFLKFLLVKLEDYIPLSRIQTFMIEKNISSRLSPKTIRRMKMQNLLVKMGKKKQMEILLMMVI